MRSVFKRNGRFAEWRRESIAVWGYAQRNYFLTKRYFLWEVVWLVYSTMNALTIGFIAVDFGGTPEETARNTTFLMIGTLIWSYLSMIFDLLSETVSWERWEGTIEYTFMSPASRGAQLLGMGIYAVGYGLIRMVMMLGAISLFFDLSLGERQLPRRRWCFCSSAVSRWSGLAWWRRSCRCCHRKKGSR